MHENTIRACSIDGEHTLQVYRHADGKSEQDLVLDGTPIGTKLTRFQLKSLVHLLDHRNSQVSYEDLATTVWNAEPTNIDRFHDTIRTTVGGLIRTLGRDWIKHEPHKGFKLFSLTSDETPLDAQTPDEGTPLDQGRRSERGYDDHTGEAISSGLSVEELLKTPESELSKALKETKDWEDFIFRSSSPTDNARNFAKHFNAADRRIVDSVVEVFGHPYLESRLPLAQTGWAPNEVFLIYSGLLDISLVASDKQITTEFTASEMARKKAGLGSALQGDSNPKFAIVDTSTPFHDVTNFTVALKKTDYFSILRTRPAISRLPELRIKFGHINPRENRVPQAAAIQFSAIFADGEILAIRRGKDTFPFPGSWSFSGEEQFDSSDLESDERDRTQSAMLRTAQEEIFPLARVNERSKRLAVISRFTPYVRSMRVWSVFLEEPTVTYSIFCVYELNLNAREYADVTYKMIQSGLGQHSREGNYHSVKLSEISTVLQGRKVSATPIFGSDSCWIEPKDLHPTSRYRLIRLIDHLHGLSKEG